MEIKLLQKVKNKEFSVIRNDEGGGNLLAQGLQMRFLKRIPELSFKLMTPIATATLHLPLSTRQR